MYKIFISSSLAILLCLGCDDKPKVINTPSNVGKTQIVGNTDGSLVGFGTLKVGNVQVVAQNYKIFVNGVNYGSIPDDAETRVHVTKSGHFEVWVNDERRHPKASNSTKIEKRIERKTPNSPLFR